MREGSSCVVSFLLGGLAGASVALVLTPRSGRRTRELVAERVRGGKRSAPHALEFSERVTNVVEAVSGAPAEPPPPDTARPGKPI